jgi:hypothetical protein
LRELGVAVLHLRERRPLNKPRQHQRWREPILAEQRTWFESAAMPQDN